MYKYTTGVVNSVNAWLTIKPPTIVMPSGRRNSEPTPVPNASGRPPSSAAAVVIIIGRKRKWHASRIASSGDFPSFLRIQRKVDHHDRVLFHQTDQQNNPDQSNDVQLAVHQFQRQQCSHPRRRNCRKDGDGMNVTLIKNSQHDINRQKRSQDQDRLTGCRILEGPPPCPETGVELSPES